MNMETVFITVAPALAPRGRLPFAARRLPRSLHPVAWWAWALGLAAAASRTTNPLLLALILVVTGTVVANRRGAAPWAVAFRYYLIGGAVIVAVRVVFRIIFGGVAGAHVLLRLPEVALAGGIRLFGPVTTEQLLGGFYDGLRLATMLVCLGAANALANPKRLLRAVPAALYEVGTAVVVALTLAPQLADSVVRVRRARRLRGARERGMRALRGIAIPVLVDAMDRSLQLAAAMDSRGYGRTTGSAAELPTDGDPREEPRGERRDRRDRVVTGALVVAGLLGVGVGVYALLDGTAPRPLGLPMLVVGGAAAGIGLRVGGKRARRTVYRPDRWRLPETLVAGCGLITAAALYLTAAIDQTNLYPSLDPLAWPVLPPVAALAIAVGALPAWLAPTLPTPPAPSTLAAPPAVPR